MQEPNNAAHTESRSYGPFEPAFSENWVVGGQSVLSFGAGRFRCVNIIMVVLGHPPPEFNASVK